MRVTNLANDRSVTVRVRRPGTTTEREAAATAKGETRQQGSGNRRSDNGHGLGETGDRVGPADLPGKKRAG